MSAIFDKAPTSISLSMRRRTVETQPPLWSLTIAGTTCNSHPRTRNLSMSANVQAERLSILDSLTIVHIAEWHSEQSQSACHRSGVPCGGNTAVADMLFPSWRANLARKGKAKQRRKGVNVESPLWKNQEHTKPELCPVRPRLGRRRCRSGFSLPT